MSEKTKDTTLDETFQQLDELAQKLEDKETSLEESIQLYSRGMKLLQECSEKLDQVEKQILEINEDGTLSEFSR